MEVLVNSWPIQQVFLEGVSLFHHSERNVYNMWLTERSRPIGGRTWTYDNSTRNTPPPFSWNAEFLMTPQSINAVASNTCCTQSCVQHYPRAKITVLRSHMYDKTTVQFKNHIKLNVHRQFHRDATGRNVVTLEGIDVCPFAWMKIMGVSLTTFYRNAKSAAQNHGNTGLRKPRSHRVVATATLGAILDRHAEHMPHKTRVLSSGEKVVAKVLPSNFKWKDQIPLVDEHLADCGLLPLKASNLSKIRWLSYPEYYAKNQGTILHGVPLVTIFSPKRSSLNLERKHHYRGPGRCRSTLILLLHIETYTTSIDIDQSRYPTRL